MNDFSNAAAHESDAPSETQSAPSAASRTPMEITKFTKPVSDGPLSKTIRLGPDGKPDPDARDCWMRDGEAQPFEFSEPFEFAEAIANCSSQNAITLGSIRAEFRPANGGAVPVVLKRALAQARGSLARTRDCLEFRSGARARCCSIMTGRACPTTCATSSATPAAYGPPFRVCVRASRAQLGSSDRVRAAAFATRATGGNFLTATAGTSTSSRPTARTFPAQPRRSTSA